MDNHFGNIVHIKLRYSNLSFQCIHIRTVVDGTRHPDSFGSSGANDIPITQLKRIFVKPADIECEILSHLGLTFISPYQHIATRNVNIIFQPDRDTERGRSLSQLIGSLIDANNRTFKARRQYSDPISDMDSATRHPPCISPIIRKLTTDRANDILHWETEILTSRFVRYGDRLEIPQQWLPLVPRHIRRGIDHIITQLGTNGDKLHLTDMQSGRHLFIVGHYLGIYLLRELHQIHLIDGYHNMGNTQQR